MTTRIILGLIAVALPNVANAFNFGFVRAPDYMDKWFLALLGGMLPFLIVHLLTKPSGLPFRQVRLHLNEIHPMSAFCFRIFRAIFFVAFVLLMIGMGLQRAAEAG